MLFLKIDVRMFILIENSKDEFKIVSWDKYRL